MNYYNENDAFAVKWLKELIKAKLIPEGEVDDRSILDVEPQDLKEFIQCHFFAGIGGWSYALELSGWNANRPVWTGSCPCQSLSCAGKGLGEKDERHLWPVFYSLIEKLRPTEIFGEQVASKDGREWLSGVRNDLETLGYAVGGADLPAASVGSPHKRNRLFWVADSKDTNRWSVSEEHTGGVAKTGRSGRTPNSGMGNARFVGLSRNNGGKSREIIKDRCAWSNSLFIQCADGKARRVPGRVADTGKPIRCGNTERSFLRKQGEARETNRIIGNGEDKNTTQYQYEIESLLFDVVNGLSENLDADRYQSIIEALNCFPLSGNIPGRGGILKGAGNAIIPILGAAFIKCAMEAIDDISL